MKNRKGFPGVVALGIVVLLVALSPVLATDSDAPRDPAGFQAMKKAGSNSAVAHTTEGGAATQGRISNMFLVDGANGGTIYEYNYQLRQIIRSCPTPIPANGVDADGLAYAGPRPGSPARLFYSNATGPDKNIYELDIDTCAVVRSFDSNLATSSGGAVGTGLSNIMDLAWGESGIDGSAVLYTVSPGGLIVPNGRIRSFNVDTPTAGWENSINLNGISPDFFTGTVGADFDNNASDLIAIIYFQDFYPDIDALDMGTAFTFVDFYDTTENIIAAGLDSVARRTDPNNPFEVQMREYHSTIAPDDTIYEYSATVLNFAAVGRVPLSSAVDPTPGPAVTDIAVGDLDSDYDGVMDLVDLCIGDRTSDNADGDLDAVGDACDNCPEDSNAGQEDGDLDGLGDVCDAVIDPVVLPERVVYMTDGFEGGTIYEYDPATGTITDSFATPELNVGSCQGLGFSQKRGSLYYINGSAATPIFWELSAKDGSVLNLRLASDVYGNTSICGLDVGQDTGTTVLWTVSFAANPQLLEHDADSFDVLGGFNLGGGIVGAGAAAATEDSTLEASLGLPNGTPYFTRNSAANNSGQNRIDGLPLDLGGVAFRRFPTINGVTGADTFALAMDGETIYMSRASKDGLYVYDFLNYTTAASTSIGLSCSAASSNAGTPCLADATCTGGLCVDASVEPQPDAAFISNPTPGGPITAVAAGLADNDFDGVGNINDNCPTMANTGQEDFDGDTFGDACDNCPGTANADQLESELFGKFDGVGDVCDNCVELFNADQADVDLDGKGDVCDFAPGFINDPDDDDDTFGPDDPAPLRRIDITQFATRIDICNYNCTGGPDVCCGLPFGSGTPSLIFELSLLGNGSEPQIVDGAYEFDIDFGEPDGPASLSIKNALVEPGLNGFDGRDVKLTATIGSSANGRFGKKNTFQGNRGLNASVSKLSTVNQLDGTIVYVIGLDALAANADAAEKLASGLDQDPLGTVEFALSTFSQFGSGPSTSLDQAPDTNDLGSPSIRDEVSIYQAFFRQIDVDPTTVDFRGTNSCSGGDADLVVVGSGTANSFITLENPSFQPLNVTGLSFSDGQFTAPVSFPFNIPPNGGSQTISLAFTPGSIGLHTATGTVQGDDPTPTSFTVIGEGLPNDAPVVSNCSVVPTIVTLGQAPTVSADVSDSATRANVALCRASGRRTSPLPVRFVNLMLVDDASTVGDVACDGRYTRNQATGGLFGRGTWEFTIDCTDRQGNVSAPLLCSDILTVN